MILDHLNNTNTALIVIDKQVGYMGDGDYLGIPFKGEVNDFGVHVAAIDSYIERCRLAGLKVIWTKMTEDPKVSPQNIAAKMLATGTPSITSPGSKSYDFVGNVPLNNEKVVEKQYYDAFAQTDLDSYLKENGITTVILVGGFASRCVLGTAFGANGYGYNVIVAEDLVANPVRMKHEIPVAMGIISSILGYVLPHERIDIN